MARLTMALVALFSLVSVAAANRVPPRDLPLLGKNYTANLVKEVTPWSGQDEELVINDQTEVKLDGRAVAYKEVPNNATIVLLEVAKNKKSIMKIHFKTKK